MFRRSGPSNHASQEWWARQIGQDRQLSFCHVSDQSTLAIQEAFFFVASTPTKRHTFLRETGASFDVGFHYSLCSWGYGWHTDCSCGQGLHRRRTESSESGCARSPLKIVVLNRGAVFPAGNPRLFENYPPVRQRLIFKGRVLVDDAVLSTVGVVDGSQVFMTACCRAALNILQSSLVPSPAPSSAASSQAGPPSGSASSLGDQGGTLLIPGC